MKRRMLAMFLALSMLLSLMPLTAFAAEVVASGTCGENLTWVLTDDGTLTISGTGAMDDWTNSTNRPWDNWRSEITAVVIEPGVTSVGMQAFSYCSKLETIELPASVDRVGNLAFFYCSNLSGIWVDSSNPYYCNDEYGVLFNKDQTLLIAAPGALSGTYIIPDSVTTVMLCAFAGCAQLTGIFVDSANPNYCSDEYGVLFDKDRTLLVAAPGALSGAYIIPDSVLTIGNSAFYGCAQLTGVRIPPSVEMISASAFRDCISLTNVEIAEGVQIISNSAFSGCYRLIELVIPASVTSIGNYAFTNCSSLESVTIPTSVIEIGAYAFYNCFNLTNIAYEGQKPQWDAISKGTRWADGTHFSVFFAPCNPGEHNWGDATCEIPKTCSLCCATEGDPLGHSYDENVCTVCGKVNYNGQPVVIYYPGGDVYLTNMVENNRIQPGTRSAAAVWWVSVDENGYLTFCNNGRYLTSGPNGNQLYLMDELSDCGRWEWTEAENGCYLRNVGAVYNGAYNQYLEYYNKYFTTYGFNSGNPTVYTFQLMLLDACEANGHSWIDVNCQNERSCTVCGASGGNGAHDYVEGICTVCGERGSTGLAYRLEEDHYVVTGIGECTDTQVFIPATHNGLPVTALEDQAFYSVDQITSVHIPASVTKIGNTMFGFSFNLSRITVADENPAFCAVDGVLYSKDMTKLICYPANKAGTSFQIPEGVTTIGGNAFEYAEKLTSILIPNTVTVIELGGFHNCFNLVSIIIPASVTDIGRATFENNSALTEIVVEQGNLYYCSQDGVLYNKDMTELICYPASKSDAVFEIPDGVEMIGHGAFRCAKYLSDVVIPQSVTTIDDGAFVICAKLTRISIPISVTSLGRYLFAASSDMTAIFYAGSEQDWDAISKEEGWNDNDWNGTADEIAIYYNVDCSMNSHAWLDASCTQPKRCAACDLTEGEPLGHNFVDGICSYCNALDLDGKYVKIYSPARDRYLTAYNTGNGMGGYWFHNAAVWQMEQQEDGTYCFIYDGCYLNYGRHGGNLGLSTELTDEAKWELIPVEHGYNVRSVVDPEMYLCCNSTFSATGYTPNMQEAYLIQFIEMEGCDATGHVWNDATCREFRVCQECNYQFGTGDHCFENGACVTCGIPVSSGLEFAPYYDGYGILRGYAVVSIAEGAEGVIVIPDQYEGQRVVAIADNAFENCTGIESVILPRTIQYIGNYAFMGCSNMVTITIPENVLSLGGAAFMDCIGLTSVVLENNPHIYWSNVFQNCINLMDVYIHCGSYASISYGILDGMGLLKHALSVHLFRDFGTMSDSFIQAYSCNAECVAICGNCGIQCDAEKTHCPECGFRLYYNTYNRVAHEEELLEHLDSTCTEDGYSSYRCIQCGYEHTVNLAASGHNYDENYICTVCSFAPQYLPMEEEQMETSILGEDGMYYTQDGMPIYIAIGAPIEWLLNHSLKEYVEAYGENYFSLTYWDQLSAMVDENGYAPLTAESKVWILDLVTGNPNWGENESTLFEYLVVYLDRSHIHDYVEEVTAPTCTEVGFTTYTCSCGNSYTANIIPAGHKWISTVSKVPTAEKAGELKIACQNCDEKLKIELPALNDVDYSCEAVMEATATSDGYDRYTWNNTEYGIFSFNQIVRHTVAEDALQIAVESTTVVTGNTIRLEVMLKNNDSLWGLSVRLDYDDSVLTLVSVENGDLLSTLDFSENTKRLIWTDDGHTTEDGVLCVLEFVVAEDADVGDYPINIIYYEGYNESLELLDPHMVSSVVTVINVAYGDVNDDGIINLLDVLMLRKYLVNIDYVTGESTVEVGTGADVNGDGVVNLLDVLMLRKYLVNIDPVTGESSVVLGPQ